MDDRTVVMKAEKLDTQQVERMVELTDNHLVVQMALKMAVKLEGTQVALMV